MPNLNASETLLTSNVRTHLQFGGARPANAVYFAGQGTQYVAITGVSAPVGGGVEPIWTHDPKRIGLYKLLGRARRPSDLPRSRVMFLEKHGSIPYHLTANGCQLNIYQTVGQCKDLSDLVNGWSSYVLIYSEGVISERELGDRFQINNDSPLEASLGVTWSAIYPVGALSFGTKASTEIDREVIDVVYGSRFQCGECGVPDDGSKWIYAVVTTSGGGSPGLPAEVVYSTNGGLTWTEKNIEGFGATEVPYGIDLVGDKLVVIGEDAYFWANLNSLTGAVGTFTEVTNGFVANKSPRDIYVLNAREVFFVGLGGYVYKATDITSGVSVIDAGSTTANNLSRIHGSEETIVAVGASNTVIKSVNRGASFATTTSTPSAGGTVQAIAVLDKYRFWIGSNAGNLLYTIDGGETWTAKSFTGTGTGNIWDIVFPTNEVGYISYASASPVAYLLTTFDGGLDWTRSDTNSPRVANWPVFNKAGRLATPRDVSEFTVANNLAVAGLSAGGTDGLLLTATVAVL